jgi:hypothetical protein
MKKFLAAVCAAALAITTLATPTYAVSDTGVIDFEDGEYASFASMKTVDADADFSEMSIVDFNGSKQLAIKTIDATKVSKVNFDPAKLWAPEDLVKIKKFSIDVTVASQDGVTPPGWNGGLIGTDGLTSDGVTASPSWSQYEFSGPEEYENPVSTTATIERKFLLPSHMYQADTVTGQLLIMRYSNAVLSTVYYDNLTAYDADGNIVPAKSAAAPAPASDGASTSASTGNTPAIIMATVMLIAGTTAMVSRRRKNK